MAVNIDGNGLIALGGTSSTQGRLRLAEDTDNGTNYIELTAPASVGSDRVITFPDATTTVVGTDTTQTLTNKSIVATQLTGTIAASALPAGSVLQVVQGNATTETAFTSTSFISTTTTASITPSSATNKILLIAYIAIQAGSSGIVSHTIFRNSTDLGNGANGFGRWFVAGSDVNVCMAYLDSPATTSSTTYDIRVKTSAATAYYNVNNSKSSIILMEIAA